LLLLTKYYFTTIDLNILPTWILASIIILWLICWKSIWIICILTLMVLSKWLTALLYDIVVLLTFISKLMLFILIWPHLFPERILISLRYDKHLFIVNIWSARFHFVLCIFRGDLSLVWWICCANLLCIKSFHLDNVTYVCKSIFAILNSWAVRGIKALVLTLMDIVIGIWVLYITHVWASLLMAQDVSSVSILVCTATILAPLTSSCEVT